MQQRRKAMSGSLDRSKTLQHVGIAAGLWLLARCVEPQQMAAIPAGPIPPGEARIWFYRVYDPSLSRNLANVDLNGARVAGVSPAARPSFATCCQFTIISRRKAREST
jgi:hypothetical protein